MTTDYLLSWPPKDVVAFRDHLQEKNAAPKTLINPLLARLTYAHNAVGVLKRRQPGRRCRFSLSQEAPLYGRFPRFLGAC